MTAQSNQKSTNHDTIKQVKLQGNVTRPVALNMTTLQQINTGDIQDITDTSTCEHINAGHIKINSTTELVADTESKYDGIEDIKE